MQSLVLMGVVISELKNETRKKLTFRNVPGTFWYLAARAAFIGCCPQYLGAAVVKTTQGVGVWQPEVSGQAR
jgi:hypothetical protein